MFHVAVGVLKDQALAEDAVHEAFLRVTKNLHKIDEDDCNATKNFLVTIVKNVAINLYNASKKIKTVPYDKLDFSISGDDLLIEDQIVASESFQKVVTELDEIGIKYSDAIKLRYYYGYSDREAGELLGTTAENIRVRCYRGKHMIIKNLGEEGNDNEQK